MQRLLVIEHEPAAWRGIEQILEVAGYHVLTAADGREGLRLFPEEPIDLLLVELLIPGMDGLDLVRSLHTTRRTSKIIAMIRANGDDLPSEIQPCSAYVVEPVSLCRNLRRQSAFRRDTCSSRFRSSM